MMRNQHHMKRAFCILNPQEKLEKWHGSEAIARAKADAALAPLSVPLLSARRRPRVRASGPGTGAGANVGASGGGRQPQAPHEPPVRVAARSSLGSGAQGVQGKERGAGEPLQLPLRPAAAQQGRSLPAPPLVNANDSAAQLSQLQAPAVSERAVSARVSAVPASIAVSLPVKAR